jgi:hypothetical protein
MTISAEAQKTKIQLESEAYRFQQITQAEGDAKQVCISFVRSFVCLFGSSFLVVRLFVVF